MNLRDIAFFMKLKSSISTFRGDFLFSDLYFPARCKKRCKMLYGVICTYLPGRVLG